MRKSIIYLSGIFISLLAVVILTNQFCFKSSAATTSIPKNIKISLFNKVSNLKTTIKYNGSNDTPEGLCANGSTLYSTKIHTDGTTSIIKTTTTNGSMKHTMPEKNLYIGHANDLTYYNGYIYAAGLNNRFYRIKDNGKNSKGLERYSIKTYSVSGVSLASNPSKYSQATWNIAHYTGRYFIFCSSINSSRYLTFRVGYFNDSTNKFVVTKTFYSRAKAFTTIQGLTYHNGYLYQATSDNGGSGNMNKLSQLYIGANYSKIVAKKTYSLSYYGTFDLLSVKKFEIESIDFDSKNQMYVLVNIAGTSDPLYKSKYPIIY